LRPDFTLTFWPRSVSKLAAEAENLISRVHFDAKYRADISSIFGYDDDMDEDERADERRSTYKRADILKMHAYRDAIRRAEGAYVIYPGTEHRVFRKYHELLPGLGAFSLRPLHLAEGINSLKEFIREICTHLSDRISQRERRSYVNFQLKKEQPPDPLLADVPELRSFKRQDGSSYSGRRAPPFRQSAILLSLSEETAIWCFQRSSFPLSVSTLRPSRRFMLSAELILVRREQDVRIRSFDVVDIEFMNVEQLRGEGWPAELRIGDYFAIIRGREDVELSSSALNRLQAADVEKLFREPVGHCYLDDVLRLTTSGT
jgi:hypothetical protein